MRNPGEGAYLVAGEPWACRLEASDAARQHLPAGNLVTGTRLPPDGEAQWQARVFRDGQEQAASGDGVRVLLAHLIDTGALQLHDRRETVPIDTPHGIRDVLLGRVGSAVDLGRWRFTEICDSHAVVCIGGTQRCVTWAHYTHPTLETLVVCPDEATTGEGIVRATARVFTPTGEERAASGLGAAAAAITLRHLSPPDTPHHWAVSFPGGEVAVRMFPTEDGEHVSVRSAVTSGG